MTQRFLEDVSSGTLFAVDDPEDVGQQAALQGLALGIRPRSQPNDLTPEQVQRFLEDDNQP